MKGKRCLFCKQDSSNTKSIEHIIPESLGNSKFILPLGYVCDKCNNYFARKVEKPFLEQFQMRLLRFEEAIPNKKNKIPPIKGLLGSTPVIVHKDIINDELFVGIECPETLFEDVLNQTNDTKNIHLLFPKFNDEVLPPNNSITSRFIAKIALEALSERLKVSSGGLDYLIDDEQFDKIRNHARMGVPKEWPCSIRRIYPTDKNWENVNGDSGQIKYECDFLFVNVSKDNTKKPISFQGELYFIVALWGIEFAINIAGPDIEGYINWLNSHNNISPLYYEDKHKSKLLKKISKYI